MFESGRDLKSSIFSGPFELPHRSVKRELLNFLILVSAGTIIKYFAVQIPGTDAYIDGRWAAGFMGFVLLRRFWLALLLAGILSLPVSTDLPFLTGFFGNLAFAVPTLLLIRYVHDRALARLKLTWMYGAGWFFLVVVCYEVIITPILWAVIATINSQQILESILAEFRSQTLLVEMILVGIVIASVMAARRLIEELRKNQLRMEHLNRILQAIRNVNQLIVSEPNPELLIEKTCKSLTESLGYESAWIALVESESFRLSSTAFSGREMCFSKIEDQTGVDAFPKCLKKVLQEKGILIVEDPSIDCENCDHFESVDNRIFLLHRLSYNFEISGILAVGMSVEYGSDSGERQLFEELVSDLSYALHKIRIAKSLETSEIKYQQLFETMVQGVIYYQPDGRVITANPAARRILGLTLREMIDRDLLNEEYDAIRENGKKIIPGDHPVIKAIQTGTPVEDFMGIKNPITKERVWVMVNAVPLFHYGADMPFMVYSTLEDITERRKGEQALRESEVRYHNLFDSIRDAILVTDLDLNIIDYNPAFIDLFKYGQGEIVGSNTRIVHDQETEHNQVTQMLENLSDDPRLFDILKFRKKTGEVFTGETSIYMLRNFKGKPKGYIGLIRDITEQIEAEDARKRIENQLQQARKMETVGALAGGVAHDFNNMLSVILAQAEMAMMELDPDHDLYRALMIIRKAAENSADLTRQLLGFARKQTIAPVVLDLNEAIGEMLNMLRRLIGENIELTWLPRVDISSVKMDPIQLNQVLSNLCVNARDAIAGHGTITIETSTISIDEEYCSSHAGFSPGTFSALIVSDDGNGMEKETMERIFEPFFTTKASGQKTGLGLSTVYGIVKQNGGFINVYSEVGEGTTFKIFLPTSKGEVEYEKKQDKSDLSHGLGETILLVEDEQTIVELGSSMLEKLGYYVKATSSPGEAISIAAQLEGGIDLLITDVVMPEMNGKELAEKIQQFHPEVKVMFMSGYTANVIAHRGVLEEGINFLQKPFLMKDLSEKVRQILDQGK